MPIPSKRLSFSLAFLFAVFLLFGPCAPALEEGHLEQEPAGPVGAELGGETPSEVSEATEEEEL
ncbi:MAG: hypothetical protein ABGY71_02410 [bacterium]|jgi:hypothetical protein